MGVEFRGLSGLVSNYVLRAEWFGVEGSSSRV